MICFNFLVFARRLVTRPRWLIALSGSVVPPRQVDIPKVLFSTYAR
jgi:hypothetical protein